MMQSKIIQGDALDTMRAMDEASIDAVVTDPPYCSGSVSESSRSAANGQGLRSENLKRFGWFVGDNMGTAGLVFLLRSIAFESVRLLKEAGSLLVFCDWRMVPNLAPAIESSGLRYQNMIVWDKTHMGLGQGFRARHEIILHFTAGSPKYHDQGTANVICCKRVKNDAREHQTQKPEPLLQELIKVVCPQGGTVLDPFGGSGSTAVAAEGIGRHGVCIERDAAHCATARQRLDGVQQSLFTAG